MPWDVDTLKTYLDTRFNDQDKMVQAAVVAIKEAVDKANQANEKRFESVNEFRASLSDQTSSFITRTEYNGAHSALEKRISDLTDRVNIMTGKNTGLANGWGILVALVATVAAGIAIVYYIGHLH